MCQQAFWFWQFFAFQRASAMPVSPSGENAGFHQISDTVLRTFFANQRQQFRGASTIDSSETST
ncbi:hypothetical protein CF61_01145 [Escherichia coli]|nr:hypothetical protein CF61_01145 [Escherichia coli]